MDVTTKFLSATFSQGTFLLQLPLVVVQIVINNLLVELSMTQSLFISQFLIRTVFVHFVRSLKQLIYHAVEQSVYPFERPAPTFKSVIAGSESVNLTDSANILTVNLTAIGTSTSTLSSLSASWID